MSKRLIIIAMLAALYPPMALAVEAAALECNKPRGKIGEPMVPTLQVAEEIYAAVAKGLGHKISGRIVAGGDGDRWHVTWEKDGPPVFGGGMLMLTINKCDGSMSGYYMK